MRKPCDQSSRRIRRLFVRAQGGTTTSLSLLSAAVLQGCSTFSPGHSQSSPGVGSDTNLLAPASGSREVRGVALNGYLDKAFVFQDLNRDGVYTTNEPADLTNSRGEFVLRNAGDGLVVVKPINQLTATELQAAREPLLSRGVVSTEGISTTYRSTSGDTVTFSGRLESIVSGSSDNVVVTPMSTFSAGLIAGGKSAEYAASKVQDVFGVNAATDYIATNNVSLRSAATAASNLLATTQSLIPEQDEALTAAWANALLSAYQQTQSQALGDIRLTQLLASDRDLAGIVTSVADNLGVELDLMQASELASQLAVLNSVLDLSGDVLELQNDTGLSQVDGITADMRVRVPLSLTGQTLEYAVAPIQSRNSESPNLGILAWRGDLLIDSLTDGYYDLYLRDAAQTSEIFSRRVLLDRTAPLSREIPARFELSELSDTVTSRFALSALQESDDFKEFTATLGMDERIQFYISGQSETIATATASNNWVNYVNIADQWTANGRDLYLYSRITDLAGNSNSPTVRHYVLDNTAPQALDLPASILQSDTGIYQNDNYSSRLEIADISKRLLSGEKDSDIRVMLTINDASPIDLQSEMRLTQDGRYDLTLYQVDSAGNKSAPINKSIILDSAAPSWSNADILVRAMPGKNDVLDLLRAESFEEWVQYSFVSAQTASIQSSWEWSNYIDISAASDRNLYTRWVDLAGNTSDARLVQGYIAPAEFESVESLINRSSITSDSDLRARVEDEMDGGLTLHFSDKFSSQRVGGLQSVTEYVVARSAESAGRSDTVGFDFLLDEAARELNSFTRENYFITPLSNAATSFRSEGLGSTSVVVQGSSFSDLYEGMIVGDIFKSGGGVDRAVLGSTLSLSGIALLSTAEIRELSSIVPSLSRDASDAGVNANQTYYRVYAESPGNDDAEGILITDAEVFQYGQNSDQYIALLFNERLSQWFFDFGASDDDIYFGGEHSFVLGGSGSDRLLGGGGSDYLVAGPSGAAIETLMGYAGDDILIGGDYVTHSFTTYYLDGGDGADVLILGNGSGIVSGGDGSDRFVINPIQGSDVGFNLSVRDFDYSSDRLVFSVPELSDIRSGVFIDYSEGIVVFDLTSILRSSATNFWQENPLAQSILKLENIELEGVSIDGILDGWIDFDTSNYSATWTDLSNGWAIYT